MFDEGRHLRAIVICDGGDFVSYAGKFVEVYEPGGWLDPGPYGCLGTGPGYALAAGLLHPGRQIVVMMGDGAAGFGMGTGTRSSASASTSRSWSATTVSGAWRSIR